MSSIRITEIFYSLQGESRTVGVPTVFVRLTGCPLRCNYCDTAYAFSGGEQKQLSEVVEQVRQFDCQYVTVTGGEPLAQAECLPLLGLLCDNECIVSLETSGAMDISKVDERVSIVMDLKTPGSGEVQRNCYENIHLLQPKDQVKFVLCDRADYQWASFKIAEYGLQTKVGEILFSPSHDQLEASELAGWILQDKLRVRMQVQLHKILWGNKPGV